MLILSRKNRESVVVGGADGFHRLLKVTVLGIQGTNVKLGFEVDPDVPVHRSRCGNDPQRPIRSRDAFALSFMKEKHMSSTTDRLGKQATEVKKDLKEMGGTVKDAAQQKPGKWARKPRNTMNRGETKFTGSHAPANNSSPTAAEFRLDRGRHRLAARSLLETPLTGQPSDRDSAHE